jgi:protein-disulfide isomerase
MRTLLIGLAVAAAFTASACGGSGSGGSRGSSAASATAGSAVSGVVHQITGAVRSAVPDGATVTDVSVSGSRVTIGTRLPDDGASKTVARKACDAASAVALGTMTFDVEGASGEVLATC